MAARRWGPAGGLPKRCCPRWGVLGRAKRHRFCLEGRRKFRRENVAHRQAGRVRRASCAARVAFSHGTSPRRGVEGGPAGGAPPRQRRSSPGAATRRGFFGHAPGRLPGAGRLRRGWSAPSARTGQPARSGVARSARGVFRSLPGAASFRVPGFHGAPAFSFLSPAPGGGILASMLLAGQAARYFYFGPVSLSSRAAIWFSARGHRRGGGVLSSFQTAPVSRRRRGLFSVSARRAPARPAPAGATLPAHPAPFGGAAIFGILTGAVFFGRPQLFLRWVFPSRFRSFSDQFTFKPPLLFRRRTDFVGRFSRQRRPHWSASRTAQQRTQQ